MNYESNILIVAAFSFSFSLIFSLALKKEKIGQIFLFIGIFFQLFLLSMRSYHAQHPPFTNIYETMILLPFLFSLRLLFWRKQVEGNIKYGIILLLILLNVSAFLLPESMKAIRPLMPALNSVWMYIHVPAYFIAYSSILVAAVLAVMSLLQPNNNQLTKKLNEEVKIAFFFLNAGLITGAIWAYFSWGTYWGWDPKEVWSLINILVLSFYFHVPKKNIKAKAIITLFTLITIIFTYFGVTFILSGLHSYS